METETEPEFWYRFEDYRACTFDGAFSYSSVRKKQFKVLKHTAKGVWLDLGLGDKRFCIRNAMKRFACPTVEEAKESFLARKKAQLKIYEKKLRNVEEALEFFRRNYSENPNENIDNSLENN